MTDNRTHAPQTPCPVHKAYAMVDGRALHYRRCGQGPAVVLLHDSPRSSRLHLGTMQALASHFTIYALDTPGYGNSDPLGMATPAMDDFGSALRAALDHLGLAQAPLYATHTSAKIALAYAAGGCAAPLLVLDGLSMPEVPASADFIATYMRPFAPEPSGAYLASEWTRIRDMLRWFPWFSTDPARRVPVDGPDGAWLLDYNIDLFSAGRHYGDAYAAAMRYDPAPHLAQVSVPTHVAARQDDVLHGFLPRAAACGNPLVTTTSLPADREAWLAWLIDTLGAAATAAPLPPREEDAARRYTSHAHGQIHWAVNGTGAPWLVLSAPTTLHAQLWAQSLPGRTLIPDLPGFGESDPLPGEDIAQVLVNGLEQLGVTRVRVLACGLAAPIGALLATLLPVERLVIDGLPPIEAEQAATFADGLCPPLSFDDHAGSHLHRIWHMLRDGEVQWPWHDTSASANRRLPPQLAPDALHAALTGVLKQPATWGNAALAALALAPAVWGQLRAPVIAFTHGDPAYAPAPALAGLCGATLIPRPDTIAEAASLLMEHA